jgi:DNA repair protein SbcD/Mre11
MFKFIHAADIHLDSPLRGLSRYDDAPVDLLRNATRMAFSKLVDMALEEDVSFVIIAGDLYDGTWRDFKTGLFFVSEMHRLRQKGIHCYLLYGNHDAESQLTKNLPLPDNVKFFSAKKAETFVLDDIQVTLHGHSYKQRDMMDNLAAGYPEPVEGTFNIGVLHTGLGGYAAHASYAPCSIEQLKAKGYDYWALGHIHQQEILHENPHIIFSGNLQGRHIAEQGAKGAVLISIQDNALVHMEWIYPDVVRWKKLELDLTSCQSREDIRPIFEKVMLDTVEQEAGGRTLAIRLVLSISADLYNLIMADEAHFRAELQALATGNHGEAVWVEQIKYKVSPNTGCQSVEEHQDAVMELQDILGRATEDKDLMQAINKDLAVLLNYLPTEISSNPDLELLSLVKENEVGRIIENVIPFLISSLKNVEEE